MIDTRMTQRWRWMPLVPMLAMLTASGTGVHAVEAADGDLDPTFGNNGRVITNFGGTALDAAHDVAIQADGKIVVVGQTLSLATATDFGVARYNPNGTLDATFGVDGLVNTDFGKGGATPDIANAVAIQSDGKIVVAGIRSEFPFADAAIARYDTNGRLDATFGGNGRVTTTFGFRESEAHDVAIASDGRIVVVGRAGGNAWAVARYTADGSLDTSFDGDGLVLTEFGGNRTQANAVSILEDGRIVVAGFTRSASLQAGFALARYNPDGSLDPSFGTGGLVETDVSPGSDTIESIAIQADGKIVAAGTAGRETVNPAFALARYEADGSLDPSFGAGGVAITVVLDASEGNDVALQADGRIIVAGGISRTNVNSSAEFAVLRFDANGAHDETFGRKGLALVDFSPGRPSISDRATALAVQSDGKIVVAGTTDADFLTSNTDFAVVRFDAASR